eukprot:m.89331 g.89331  ORF g.89331 m.89331 type:complete len:447 (-) comp12891_c1_seq1:104-1444(-)
MSRGLYNVLVHGLGFMAIFTAFQTSGAFQATVLDKVLDNKSLGYESLAIIYALFAFANFISPVVVKKLGNRVGMVAGATFYTLFIGVFLTAQVSNAKKVAPPIILAASALLGIAAAVTWTSQGEFITANSNASNRGRYSGIFWSLLQCSLLIGNSLLYFVVGTKSIDLDLAMLFYEILLGVAAGGVLILCLTRSPASDDSSGGCCGSKPEEGQSTALLSAEKEEVESESVLETMKSTFKMVVRKEMLVVSVLIMYSGVELTLWSSVYETLVGQWTSSRDIGLSGIVIGAAEIFGGVTMGRLADATSHTLVLFIGVAAHAAAFSLIYFNLHKYGPHAAGHKPLPLSTPLPISALLGLGDSIVNTIIYTYLSSTFSKESSHAFALFKFFQSLTAGISFAYAAVNLAYEYQVLIAAIMLVLGTVTFIAGPMCIRSSKDKEPVTFTVNSY